MPLNEKHFCELRQSINDLFGFIKRTLFLIGNITSDNVQQSLNLFQLCASILKELKSLLIFTGRISQFRHFLWLKHRKSASTESPFQHLLDQKTALYSYYHVVLEIWWSTVEISSLMQMSNLSKFSFNDIFLVKEDLSVSTCKISGHPMFTQSIRILLYDILLLGSRSHFETKFTPSTDYHYQSPFICTCSWEIVVAIRMLITSPNSSTDLEKMSTLDQYYNFLFDVLSLFDGSTANHKNGQIEQQQYNEEDMQTHEVYFEYFSSISFPKIAIYHESYYRLFQVWIFSNIVPLLLIDLDVSNHLRIGTFKVTHPAALTKLVRQALKNCEASNSTQAKINNELIVYNLLILTLKNSQYLTFPNFDLLLLFVEYFLKKLNVNYNVHSGNANSVQEYISWMPRNSLSWHKDVEQMLNSSNEPNNFKLFLRLLARQLQEIFSCQNDELKNVNGNFQKLVSKIVITLQPRSLKLFDLMGVFNLCTFYLTLVLSIPDDRCAEILDKALNIFGEIGKNICAESKPNGSMAGVLVQFHFGLIQQEKFSNDVIGKVTDQLLKLFEKLQIALLNCSLSQYIAFVRLYFDELGLLVDSLKSSRFSQHYLQLLEKLVLPLDLIAIQRNVRSSKQSSDFQKPPQVIETLGELLQFCIESIQENESCALASDFLENLSSLEYCHNKKEMIEFSKKLNEKLENLTKTELVNCSEEADLEMISNVAFNITLSTLLIE